MPLTREMQREILEYCLPYTSRLKGLYECEGGAISEAYENGQIDDDDIMNFVEEVYWYAMEGYGLDEEDEIEEEYEEEDLDEEE